MLCGVKRRLRSAAVRDRAVARGVRPQRERAAIPGQQRLHVHLGVHTWWRDGGRHAEDIRWHARARLYIASSGDVQAPIQTSSNMDTSDSLKLRTLGFPSGTIR